MWAKWIGGSSSPIKLPFQDSRTGFLYQLQSIGAANPRAVKALLVWAVSQKFKCLRDILVLLKMGTAVRCPFDALLFIYKEPERSRSPRRWQETGRDRIWYLVLPVRADLMWVNSRCMVSCSKGFAAWIATSPPVFHPWMPVQVTLSLSFWLVYAGNQAD